MKNQYIQDKMQSLLDEIVASGRDIGMQLAVYYKSELIVNAWAGVANTDTKKSISEHTMFPVFSATKGITATMLHILADRGALDYDQRVCELWPEFAKNGKEDILIRQVLNHTAGIPQMPENLTVLDLNNWDGMCDKIADLKPLWAPGSRLEYHALTYGWIVGRIIELASKKTFTDFFNQEVRVPLGAKSMHIGIPNEIAETSSIATLYEPGFDKNNLNTNGVIAIPECCMPMTDWINQYSTLQACIPAGNGIFNALSLARHYATLLPGGIDGVTLLSEDTIKKATKVSSLDNKPGGTSVFGLGYALFADNAESRSLGDQNTVFGHIGYGGSMGFADLKNNFALALTKNYINKDSAEIEIVRAVQELLDIPQTLRFI